MNDRIQQAKYLLALQMRYPLMLKEIKTGEMVPLMPSIEWYKLLSAMETNGG